MRILQHFGAGWFRACDAFPRLHVAKVSVGDLGASEPGLSSIVVTGGQHNHGEKSDLVDRLLRRYDPSTRECWQSCC